jgi:FAD/FMN-containing dehydrogenase
MVKHSRRDFLKTSGAGALAVGLGAYSQPPAAATAIPDGSGGVDTGGGHLPVADQEVSPMGGTGTMVWRGDPDYEQTRRRMVWNERLPERSPEVIVTVASEQDVVEAVKLARSRGLRIAVRSGGHNWVGTSLRDGGMLIDLSRLSAVAVDPAAHTAAVQPALTNTELVAALAQQGLAFPAGHCPSVAVGGYLLSGGLGWNGGSWGPACRSVLAVDLVDADGALITADAQQRPDLYWMARGVGPAFPGVITRYHLRVFPAPRAITSSVYVYPLDQLEAVVPWLAATVLSLSSTVEALMFMGPPPPQFAAQRGDRSQRQLILWAIAFGDTRDQTRAALAPLETSPVLDRALAQRFDEPVSFDDLFAIEAEIFPEDHRYAVEATHLRADPLPVLSGLRARLAQAPSPKTTALVVITAPPTLDAAAPEMAYSLAAPFYIGCYSIWENAADDEANLRWQRGTVQSLEPIALGYYIGETDLLASPSRAAHSFAPGVWERLQAVRQQYDPHSVFYSHIGQA